MFENKIDEIQFLLDKNLLNYELEWLNNAIKEIEQQGTARKLYLNYSLCGNKINHTPLISFSENPTDLEDYLRKQRADTVEISRVWILLSALQNNITFVNAVKNLIQIADKSELETFLKYLIFLPDPKNYQFAAVEALRTNISTVFEAISKHNPYPSLFFTDHQWNQMYLKAAFMQLDLSTIVSIDKRANADLAQIISDYAHERWAASRTIDPYFWRPVSNFLTDDLINDVKCLFESTNVKEQYAAALVCKNSKLEVAKRLLDKYPELKQKAECGEITWQNIKK